MISGHELLFLINFVNWINIFYIATGSAFLGMFITAILMRVGLKNFA